MFPILVVCSGGVNFDFCVLLTNCMETDLVMSLLCCFYTGVATSGIWCPYVVVVTLSIVVVLDFHCRSAIGVILVSACCRPQSGRSASVLLPRLVCFHSSHLRNSFPFCSASVLLNVCFTVTKITCLCVKLASLKKWAIKLCALTHSDTG